MQQFQPRRHRRADASRYLKERWGIDRTPGTLAKLATIGGGPRYQLANRVPLYPEPELDDWAQSILGPLKSSTSDAGEVDGGQMSAVFRRAILTP
jgi:hypothetical protein